MTKFLATCDNTVISVCHTAYYESTYSIEADANIEALVAWVSTADGLTPIQATGGRWHRKERKGNAQKEYPRLKLTQQIEASR